MRLSRHLLCLWLILSGSLLGSSVHGCCHKDDNILDFVLVPRFSIVSTFRSISLSEYVWVLHLSIKIEGVTMIFF